VSSTEIAEQENEHGLDILHDRVNVLKRLTEDIHGEADGHNRLLDGMASAMDASRGIMSGTMDRFKRVSEIFSVLRHVNVLLAIQEDFTLYSTYNSSTGSKTD
jgi:blocked-early-in-transport protein 1